VSRIGLAAAIPSGPSFVSATNASDPRLFGGAALLVTAAVVVATLLPAKRAAGIDPAIALRGE
jgi:ABC-type antimicrobial peptide transport system permease subunit